MATVRTGRGTMAEPRRTPPVRWQPPLARRLLDRNRAIRAVALGTALVGLTAVIQSTDPQPRLVWNASASAPVGFWAIAPGAAVTAGDMVLARTPPSVRKLAAERRYLPANVPLLKRLVTRPNDWACALGGAVTVNGELVAVRRAADRRGRPLPWWTGCRSLGDDMVLLLMDAPDSFDGRYFGPVPRSSLIGKATPLWLR